MEVRCYLERSNKGSNLASPARVVADIAVEPSKGPYALYISKVEGEQVREAIQQLPVEFREIILLREYKELSYQRDRCCSQMPARDDDVASRKGSVATSSAAFR